MTNADDDEAYYATLGLAPDATLAQVKARYRELNDAYLKILELSRSGDASSNSGRASVGGTAHQGRQRPGAGPGQTTPQKTHTEPMAALKEKLATGKISQSEFERLAKARYDYLESTPFSELSDSEFEERLHGFEGVKIHSS